VEWLLASIFAHFPAQKGSVAAVCFNVKGPDLLFLDQPSGKLDDADRAIYERLGVPAEPFGRVHYYAPYAAKGFALATLRSHDALQHNVRPLTWGLKEVFQYAQVLLNKDDVDAKADALIDFVDERVLNREFTDPLLRRPYRVTTFAELEEWFRDLLIAIEGKGGGDTWRTHHIATIRKVRNRLSNIALRCQGLVTDGGTVSDLPFGTFEDRAVYVVDVANMEEDAQDLVFTRVVQKLREHLERRDLGVQHVVVFVDELNKYAPGTAPTRTSARCCSTSPSAGGTSGSCSSARSSSGARCTGAWWGTRGRRSTGAWTATNSPRRATPCSAPRSRRSSPRWRRGS
jgi:hypothetical protein